MSIDSGHVNKRALQLKKTQKTISFVKMFKFVIALLFAVVAMASAGDFYCNQFNNNCLGTSASASYIRSLFNFFYFTYFISSREDACKPQQKDLFQFTPALGAQLTAFATLSDHFSTSAIIHNVQVYAQQVPVRTQVLTSVKAV